AASLAGAGAAAARLAPALRGQEAKSKVVEVVSPGVLASGEPDAERVRQMIARGITALTGEDDPAAAWRSFVGPDDVVGIKINCLGGPGIITSHAVTDAIIEGCRSAGVPTKSIIVWDRFQMHLLKSGYEVVEEGDGVRCYGTEGGGSIGYDDEVFWECDPPDKKGNRRSRLTKILTRQITKMINVPVLKDHAEAGVTFCLKNVAYGVADNTARTHEAPWHCDPFTAEICAMPAVRDKWVLNIGDALRGVYEGGPTYSPAFAFEHNTILLSLDPVAMDQIALETIVAKRQENGRPPLEAVGRPPKHIATAARKGLGTNDPRRIERVKLSV
ncbi:MAG: DUF362 domain-containing protein, partial [Armatimonadota bacterium]